MNIGNENKRLEKLNSMHQSGEAGSRSLRGRLDRSVYPTRRGSGRRPHQPAALDRYPYVPSNATMLTDPSRLSPWDRHPAKSRSSAAGKLVRNEATTFAARVS